MTPDLPPDGFKADSGKPDYELVLSDFAEALHAVVEVGTWGATCHERSSWMRTPDGKARYNSAMLRHDFAMKRGEVLDPGSNKLHAAHTAWNALAHLHFALQERKKKRGIIPIVSIPETVEQPKMVTARRCTTCASWLDPRYGEPCSSCVKFSKWAAV